MSHATFQSLSPSLQIFNDDEILEFQPGIIKLIQKIKKIVLLNMHTSLPYSFTQSRNVFYEWENDRDQNLHIPHKTSPPFNYKFD